MKERIPLILAGKLSVVGLAVVAAGALSPLVVLALPLGASVSGPSLGWWWLALVTLAIL